MTIPDYDYHGLIASTWDLWRDDTAGWSDRHFYLDVIRRYGQPALDIGCQIVEREEEKRSPEGRWYSQQEVMKLYEDVGFVDIQLYREFELTPAAAEDRQFSALGVKPPG